MASRDSLHRMIDDLPETEIPRAERILEALRETAERPLYTLENAPEADEPETPEEVAAVAEAWKELREGQSITTEELKQRILPSTACASAAGASVSYGTKPRAS